MLSRLRAARRSPSADLHTGSLGFTPRRSNRTVYEEAVPRSAGRVSAGTDCQRLRNIRCQRGYATGIQTSESWVTFTSLFSSVTGSVVMFLAIVIHLASMSVTSCVSSASRSSTCWCSI